MTGAGTAALRTQMAGHHAGHCARHLQAAGSARTGQGGRNANGSPATTAADRAAANGASGPPPRQPSEQDKQP